MIMKIGLMLLWILSNPMNKKIAIIGGGISGLTAAYYLNKKGYSPTIFEASSQIGGVIQTKKIDGFIIETGPNTILLSDQRTEDMISDLGLCIEDASPESTKRYIVKNGKCTALPMSFRSFFSTSLFSFSTKFKILTEFLRRNKPLEAEESISQFIIRRFGKEVLHYAINPFIADSWSKRSVLLISLLLGFYFTNSILSFLLDKSINTILLAILILLIMEVSIRTTLLSNFTKLSIIIISINNFRIGSTYALILEAFKLGS